MMPPWRSADGVENLDQPAAIVPHRAEVQVDQRLKDLDALRPLDGEHRPKAAHVGEDDLLPRGLCALRSQMGLDPIDDLPPVAGVDDDDIERLAVGVAIVAHQHVVENSAGVVGHQRIADLAEFHVRDAAGEQLGEEDGGPGPLEPQAAHVGDVEDSGRRPGGQMFVDDRRVLERHCPAGEPDHAAAVGDMPLI